MIVIGCVYWIRDTSHTDIKVDGYVGISIDVESRWDTHKVSANNGTHYNSVLSSEIRDNKNLIWEVVWRGPIALCAKLEKHWRPKCNIGWNIAAGGISNAGESNPMFGNTHSSESKYKMRIAKLGKTMSEQAKTNMSKARKGVPKPKGFGKMVSFHNKLRVWTDEAREKISKAHRGKVMSEASRKQISASTRGDKHHRSVQVICIETGIRYGSMMEAERLTGINRKQIAAVCNGTGKTAGTYTWKFCNKEKEKDK